eukprot:scaffold276362_cov18-Tisochrysis_lutea.AAC.1
MPSAMQTLVDVLAHVHVQHVVEYQPGGDVNEAVQQLAFADLILLNKVDLVDEEGKVSAEIHPDVHPASKDILQGVLNLLCHSGTMQCPRLLDHACTHVHMQMEVMAAIKHINNTAKIVECRLSGDSLLLPSMERILDANTFSVNRALEVWSRLYLPECVLMNQ